MLSSSEERVLEQILENLNQGIVYVDQERKIRLCNKKAKEITGIAFGAHDSHEAGCIADGDVVILADNMVGDDDGNLSAAEFRKLNITDEIKKDEMLVAVGVYQNEKIDPIFKHVREHNLGVPLVLDANYYGFSVKASIDTAKKTTEITVNAKTYTLPYYRAIANMVIIDGRTGRVKFFQAKGYSTRGEDAGEILRGKPFQAKKNEANDRDVLGKPFLELFDNSELSQMLFSVMDGKAGPIKNWIYELNKRPVIGNIFPGLSGQNGSGYEGVFLTIEDAARLETLLEERNELLRQMEARNEYAHQRQTPDFPEELLDDFAGRSEKAKAVKYMAYKASQSRFNVLLTGESGTGKTKLARAIHQLGNPQAPFVEVNCSAIAPSLFESELFGYVGGAFTGAKSEGKVGFFEAADRGTIFLDEIGEMAPEIQVKLLHVLQNKTIYRVGSSKPVKIDVRVIAATNKNVEEEVAQGRIRQDLYYRLNVFPIHVPPIREHKADLYLLINQLLLQICRDYGLEPKQFSGEAIQQMLSYDWPGNVRELENVIERAISICDSDIVYAEHLCIGSEQTPVTMKEILAQEEKRVMEMTLMKYNGDKQKAMKELDVSKSVFYDKLKRYQIK